MNDSVLDLCMKYSIKTTVCLVKACSLSPVWTTIVNMLFYVWVNLLIAQVEKLIFGERFEHWGDPIVVLVFIAYSGYCIYICSLIKQGFTLQDE